jgi:hypothetical protein
MVLAQLCANPNWTQCGRGLPAQWHARPWLAANPICALTLTSPRANRMRRHNGLRRFGCQHARSRRQEPKPRASQPEREPETAQTAEIRRIQAAVYNTGTNEAPRDLISGTTTR